MKSKTIIISLMFALFGITGSSYSAAPAEPLPTARGKAVTMPATAEDQKKISAALKERDALRKKLTREREEAVKQQAALQRKEIAEKEEALKKKEAALAELLRQKEIAQRAYAQKKAENIEFIEQYNKKKSSLEDQLTKSQNKAQIKGKLQELAREKRDNVTTTHFSLILSLQSDEKYYLAYIDKIESEFNSCNQKLLEVLGDQAQQEQESFEKRNAELAQLLEQKEKDQRNFDAKADAINKFNKEYTAERQALKQSKNQNANLRIKELNMKKNDNAEAANVLLIAKLESAKKYYLAYIETLKSKLEKCDEALHHFLTEQIVDDREPAQRPANIEFTQAAHTATAK